MIEILSLTKIDSIDLQRVASGYSSDGKYVVTYYDSESHASFDLQLVSLPEPYIKSFDHYDEETLRRYEQVLTLGYSFGAYDDELLAGLVLAEPQEWNRSLSVWEFHVAAAYRRLGFKVEGIDISYYSNHDYPQGEVAIFMKRRV
jgi:ribosomal protein S18 acetylase RimI-like enzyme